MPLADLKAELADVGIDRFTASDYRPGRTTHIVLFRYRPDVTDAQRSKIARRFHALAQTERNGEPYIASIRSGDQCSGETAPGGHDRAFIVMFRSLGDRNFYVGEPVFSDREHLDIAHAEFKEFVGPFLAEDGALVFDFHEPDA
ncbi:Dabb family protein [Diaminobutyricibacter tongyongensis]|uniref:Dabb family protein n=1 Tax=Leifsonia tongyongensis TaxID=1268043 RepID=A0A6L9XUE3_9MICO|nr:Dabb family protein [Diaminobutyricibacter tongyongensis]NEN04993.1 Dabb family protein [Diaminobutyricibacter tongyongensis]